MPSFVPVSHRIDYLRDERLPNMTGMVLCALISLPIWVAILAIAL